MNRMMNYRLGALLLGFAALLSLGQSQVVAARACLPTLDHVVVVIEENHGFNQIMGNANAPYFNALAARGALFTDAHGVAHPSQPNYVAWWSGSTHGLHNDSVRKGRFSSPNWGTRLAAVGKRVRAVEEPPVVNKHAPWVSFERNGSLLRSTTMAPPATLDALTFIVPNQRNDMHSGSIARGDAWLRDHLPAWIERLGPRDVIILTFDEDNFSPANHIPMVWFGPPVRRGRITRRIDHFNVLRALGIGLGIEPLSEASPVAGALDCAAPIP